MAKEPLSDVWVFDTHLAMWTELRPELKIQGNTAGKKIKKQFEPRLAHTAAIFDQFVIIFGGMNSSQERNSLISNDLYVLCLNDLTERIFPPE